MVALEVLKSSYWSVVNLIAEMVFRRRSQNVFTRLKRKLLRKPLKYLLWVFRVFLRYYQKKFVSSSTAFHHQLIQNVRIVFIWELDFAEVILQMFNGLDLCDYGIRLLHSSSQGTFLMYTVNSLLKMDFFD